MSKVYILRNCLEDMTSHDGFVWPKSGYVSCSDWSEENECGNGLHGFLWGVGNTDLLYPLTNCQWLIVEVDEDKIIDLGDKVKFPEGNVVFCTQSRDEAIDKMIEYGASPNTIMYGTSTSGDGGTSTSGDYGTSTSGRCGNSTSGYFGTSISGDFGYSYSIQGKVKTGNNGVIAVGYSCLISNKRTIKVGHVPEELKPNTFYKVVDGEWVETD